MRRLRGAEREGELGGEEAEGEGGRGGGGHRRVERESGGGLVVGGRWWDGLVLEKSQRRSKRVEFSFLFNLI